MDYCFMRTDTGYDVMMLAVRTERGVYRVYRLGPDADEPPVFEESDPSKLREQVRKWCRAHLPKELEMIRFPVRNNRQDCLRIKAYLKERQIPFEMKLHTFYVRKREYDRIKDDLERMAGVSNEA
ncbi:hypothetical protein ACFO4N_04510 [Camelliibacillus cellulosilyticus]|uniref:Uncharacterized protein n=1 Tax=Camelliibacillus cellulosilyticus TaxID=2174486 RepID=A0ABV9GL48_9BACL